MSWLFSRALVVEFSAANCSDGGLFAPLKSTDIPQAFWSPGKTTDNCPPSLYGMTFALLTVDRGEELLTSFRAASRARISAQRGRVLASRETDQGCGMNSRESLARFDLDSSSWKTRQCSLLEGLDRFSETWPRWGMMRSGECFLRAPLARHTHEKGCSCWPTPTKSMSTRGWGLGSERNRTTGHQRFGEPAKTNILRDISIYGWKLNPFAMEWLMGWPIGWTDLKPLETGRFQQWLDSHGRL